MASTMADNSTNDKPSSSMASTKTTNTQKGKRKITIEPIINKRKRQVTFSKRRTGLFNKAEELSSVCDAKIAVITFSNGGKMFSFGNPNTDNIVHRYINDNNHDQINLGDHNIIEQINPEIRTETNQNVEVNWWEKPIDDMGLNELEEFKVKLEGLRNEVISKFNHNSSINVENQKLAEQVIDDRKLGDQVIDDHDHDHDHDMIKNGSREMSECFGIIEDDESTFVSGGFGFKDNGNTDHHHHLTQCIPLIENDGNTDIPTNLGFNATTSTIDELDYFFNINFFDEKFRSFLHDLLSDC